MNINSNNAGAASHLTHDLTTPIVLVGMMGAGKSHVGATLAKQLGLEFFDSDKQIESLAGCSVGEIFDRFGEAKFRESEKKVVLNLLDGPPCVIATGGGTVTNEEALRAIKEKSISIWLNPALEILVERVQGRGRRPLLVGEDPATKLSELLTQRQPQYAQADIVLDIDRDNKSETLRRAIKLLSERLKTDRF